MSANQDLMSTLLRNAGVAALVGTRITRMTLPKTPTLPAIVFQGVVDQPQYTHSGNSHRTQNWQFVCWSATADGAETLADAVEDALDGLETANLKHIFIENRLPRHEAGTDLNSVIVEVSSQV